MLKNNPDSENHKSLKYFSFSSRMQQQQLAAQLAHHGGSRQPPLSPAPHTSDSDSDISLGAHSPPISSPGPLRFGPPSPSPLSTFRFGPHSPGPMPSQFRFGVNHSPTDFRPNNNTGGYRIDSMTSRRSESPICVDKHSPSPPLQTSLQNVGFEDFFLKTLFLRSFGGSFDFLVFFLRLDFLLGVIFWLVLYHINSIAICEWFFKFFLQFSFGLLNFLKVQKRFILNFINLI